MKRIILGRANDSHVVINDDTDNVSRHHAVITFSFWGKMTLSDTSSNGTFVNGTRMQKGASIPVTRKDRIQFGTNWILDWAKVHDPYRNSRLCCIFGTCAIVLALTIGCCWYVYQETNPGTQHQTEIGTTVNVNQDQSWNKDSTLKVAPVIEKKTEKDIPKRKKSSKSRVNKNKRTKKSSEKVDLRNLPKSNSTPIIN